MQSQAETVDQYIAELPADRRLQIQAVRSMILKNLPKGFEEGMQYGMIGYYVPHRLYPDGYHCDPKQPLPYVSLASQKNHMAVYMMHVYGNPELSKWFQQAWAKSGKKLDMGKSCVRFKRVDDIPLEVIGAAVKKVTVKSLIAWYESTMKPSSKPAKKAVTKTAAKKKPAAKKQTKKSSTKKAAPKKKTVQTRAAKTAPPKKVTTKRPSTKRLSTKKPTTKKYASAKKKTSRKTSAASKKTSKRSK